MAFLVICVGITILQMSKVDPTEFKKLDRRSTILLQAARQQTEAVEEKSVTSAEDPGIDALRGSFGTVGSIIRARSARRISQSSRGSVHSSRLAASSTHLDIERGDSRKFSGAAASSTNYYGAMQRHQLFDPPVPRSDVGDADSISMASQRSNLAKKTSSTLTTVIPLERMTWPHTSVASPLTVLVPSRRRAHLNSRVFLHPRTPRGTRCASFHLRRIPGLGLCDTIPQLRGCAQHRPVLVYQLKPTMTPLTAHLRR